jgi:4a-hydroxytetrahydrobiopterin dehydratase
VVIVESIDMKTLVEKNCEHDSSNKTPVEQYERDKYLNQLKGWQLVNQCKGIERTFEFKNYYHTMSFVNAIAWIANREAHHPDLMVSYASCKVLFTTHEMGGLGMNDLICAAKVSALLESGNFGPQLKQE